jgi:hypothetical protein
VFLLAGVREKEPQAVLAAATTRFSPRFLHIAFMKEDLH